MILATKGGDATVRDASIGAVLAAEGLTRSGSAATTVSGKTIGGLPAYNLAIRIAAEAVAKRRQIMVWRGVGADRRQITGSWQARFFAGQPNERESWFQVLEGTEASLTARNNAVWLKLFDAAGRVATVYVIHPDNVEPRWNSDLQRCEYRIRGNSATWSDWLGPDQILHFRVGYPEPGSVWAPSPVQLFRDSLGAALAKVRFERNLYDRGVMQQIAVIFPDGIKKEQAESYRDLVQSQAGGVENSGGVRVFGGGVRVETIGLSMSDAQFVEAMNLDVEQVARITGVTASLLGASAGSGVKTAPTPEQEEDRWHRYGLEPRLARLEEAVKCDPSFFGPAARDFPEFAHNRLRADRATEVQSLVKLVQAGIVVPDTAAAELGYPALPGGAGQIVQITPVGGAPNDTATTTSTPSGGE